MRTIPFHTCRARRPVQFMGQGWRITGLERRFLNNGLITERIEMQMELGHPVDVMVQRSEIDAFMNDALGESFTGDAVVGGITRDALHDAMQIMPQVGRR